MKFSHECHVDIMEELSSLNNYEYGLLHMMHIPEYKDYFENTVKELYLDNSAFEYQFLDEKFDLYYFYDIIDEINPDVVIVPDVLDNTVETIKQAENFIYSRPNREYMGVCQGKTIEELHECYMYFYECDFDIIAIPFHSEAYQLPGVPKEKADALDPAVLKLIKMTVDAARKNNGWVGVCGALGDDPQALPNLIGLGVDELSVSIPVIPTVKARVRTITEKDCVNLAEQALKSANAAEVRSLVKT